MKLFDTTIDQLNIPQNLDAYLDENKDWYTDVFDPIFITIDKILYGGPPLISYQLEFEAGVEFEMMDGHEWEEAILKYIQTEDEKLSESVKGISDMTTCVLWTDNQSNFKKLLELTMQFLEKIVRQ